MSKKKLPERSDAWGQPYRDIFELMKYGIVLYGSVPDGDDFVVTDMNQTARNLALGSENDLMSQSLGGFSAEADQSRFMECIRRVQLSGDPETFHSVPYKCEKAERWFEVYVYRLPVGELVTVWEDISSRMSTESDLWESEERWQFALENSLDGIWDWNIETNEVFFSKQWKAMLGYGPSEIGNNLEEWESRLHPDDRDQCREDIEKHLMGETQSYENEHRLLCKDGSYKWILDRGRIIKWTVDGKPLRAVGMHTDISRRKSMEEAFKQSEEEKFRTVADYTHDWEYWIKEDGVLAYISPSCERITGYPPKAFIKDPGLIMQIVHPDDKQLVQEHFKFHEISEPHEFDYRIVTRWGETRWIGHSCQPVRNKHGVYSGRRVSNREITDRKLMEEDLRQKTADLERSNRDLEQFAYVAAHDLREPLVAVAAYLKIVERLSKGLLDENGCKCVSKALHLALRMDAMLQGLLSYSRITTSDSPPEPTDANTCLSEALSNLGFSIKKCSAEITSDSLPTVRMDSTHLVTIFQNLIGNSIKYRRTDPVKIHVGCLVKESDYEFYVSDNGIGISPPYLDRIFGMFERIKELTGPSGTGIGLATCRKIVERYGGKMWVNSEIGLGSTFYFSLPNKL